MSNSTKETSASRGQSSWLLGFTPKAESLNGRLAMIGFVSVLLVEVFSGQGLLHLWNVL